MGFERAAAVGEPVRFAGEGRAGAVVASRCERDEGAVALRWGMRCVILAGMYASFGRCVPCG